MKIIKTVVSWRDGGVLLVEKNKITLKNIRPILDEFIADLSWHYAEMNHSGNCDKFNRQAASLAVWLGMRLENIGFANPF